jgi:hypothetical protein
MKHKAGLVISCVVLLAGVAWCSSQSGPSSDSNASGGYEPATSRADDPAPKPPSRLEQKRMFLKTVDESISGARIAGNPYKFVGDNVDLHCHVSDVPDPQVINADCGSEDDPVNIVIQIDSSSLEKGQALRILGTVQDPMQGTNAMGGAMTFPTVKSLFAE